MKTFEITYAVNGWLYRTHVQAENESDAMSIWTNQHNSTCEIRDVRRLDECEE